MGNLYTSRIKNYATLFAKIEELDMNKMFIFLALFGCSQAPVQLNKEAESIEVLVNKPQGCKTVGKFLGKDNTGSKDMALNSILNQAASQGATSVHINAEVPNGKNIEVHGTGYKCD